MKLSALTLLSLLVVSASGCSSDPVPPPGTPLETLWPNEDGRSWTYDLSSEFWEFEFQDPEFVFGTPQAVPDAPGLQSLFPLIDAPSTPAVTEVYDTWYQLHFDGEITTQSGVTAQNLVEIRGDGHLMTSPAPAGAPVMGDGFLGVLAMVRPELFPDAQTQGFFTVNAHPQTGLDPGLLHGGAWRREADWIGTFGDFSAQPSWRFLQGDPKPGDRFSFQLVPGLAPDVFLHAIVRGELDIETPVGTFTNALDVVYLIDFGIAIFSGPTGPDAIGFSRSISFGNIVYAPTVGPVASYERVAVPVGQELGDGFGHLTLDLIEIQAGTP